MTTNPKPTRADLVRQRRAGSKPAAQPSKRPAAPVRQTYRSDDAYRSNGLRPVSRPRSGRFAASSQTSVLERILPSSSPARPAPRPTRRGGNDYSFSIGRTAVHTPGLSIPQLGSRWISLVASLFLVFLLYTMWTSSLFTVKTAEVRGNDRLSTADINGVLGLVGQPIFKAVPATLQNNLRTTFPDLAKVRVSVGFPNHVYITVVERTPVLAWYQDNGVTWIDGNGIAFMPRGAVSGLIQVSANTAPPKQPLQAGQPLYDQTFIDPAMVKAIVTLSPYVPAGAPMIYDPEYGMGWQDSNDWSVFFGQNTQDIPMKLVIYQAIVNKLKQDGIQPKMVSMEYLDAPFYK